MKFFKPEDFPYDAHPDEKVDEWAAKHANAKLEREGKVVFGHNQNESGISHNWTRIKNEGHNLTALLINIEPIEKCKHPKEKVTYTPYSHQNTLDPNDWAYVCKCGARVTPSSFVTKGEET